MSTYAKSIKRVLTHPDFEGTRVIKPPRTPIKELTLEDPSPRLDKYIIKSHYAYNAINNNGRVVTSLDDNAPQSEITEGNTFTVGAYSSSTRKSKKEHRIRVDGVFNTLSTGKGGGFRSSVNIVRHGNKLRFLTPLECERLMSWPDDYTRFGQRPNGEIFELSDNERYFLCGNGIISQITKHLLKDIKEEINVYSTFAGCDGSSLLLPKNFKKIAFCEFDDLPASVLRFHHPNTPIVGDISSKEAQSVKGFDLLITSPPCQTFSDSGAQECFLDERGTLFFKALKIIRKNRPKYVLFENVEGLGKRQEGRILLTIAQRLKESGYKLELNLLRGYEYGVPQNRPRIYILCTRID